MKNKPLIGFAIAAAIMATTGSAMAADAAAGEEVFKKEMRELSRPRQGEDRTGAWRRRGPKGRLHRFQAV